MQGAGKKGAISLPTPQSILLIRLKTRVISPVRSAVWVVVGAETVGTGEGIVPVDGLGNVLSAQEYGREGHTRDTIDVSQMSHSSLNVRHPRTNTIQISR